MEKTGESMRARQSLGATTTVVAKQKEIPPLLHLPMCVIFCDYGNA